MIPATVVPLGAGGDVDWAALARYLRTVAAAGPAALAVTADTGEVAQLSLAEQVRIVRLAKAETGLPVVAGLTAATPPAGPGARDAVERARALGDAGADALLVFPRPDLTGPGQATGYHRALATAGVPLVAFQLQPALGGVLYDPGELAAILALGGVVALKEASFDRRRFAAAAAAVAAAGAGVALLTGNDNFLLESFDLGAGGALLGLGAVLTGQQVALVAACREGRRHEARDLAAPLQRLSDAVFAPPVGAYRARLKECLVMLGVLDSAAVRPPLGPIGDGDRRRLRQALDAALTDVPAA